MWKNHSAQSISQTKLLAFEIIQHLTFSKECAVSKNSAYLTGSWVIMGVISACVMILHNVKIRTQTITNPHRVEITELTSEGAGVQNGFIILVYMSFHTLLLPV